MRFLRQSVLVLAAVVSVSVFAAAGPQSQQPASPAAGKWEVLVDGQAVRIAELTIEGTAVKGTLTRFEAEGTIAVTGEIKNTSLTFWTPNREESFGVVLRDVVQGTYVYCTDTECWKTGVRMRRPVK